MRWSPSWSRNHVSSNLTPFEMVVEADFGGSSSHINLKRLEFHRIDRLHKLTIRRGSL